MAISGKDNGRRAHAAETARQITSSETAAFFTTLLAVLNEASAAPHAGHSGPDQPAVELAPHPFHPHLSPTENVPADLHSGAQHVDSTDAALPTQPMLTAQIGDAVAPEVSGTAPGATPADALSAAHVTAISIPAADSDASADRGPPHEPGVSDVVTSAASIPVASVLQPVDVIKSVVDGSLSAVSQVVSEVGTTIGQLASSLSGTINHLTDSLTGLVSTLVHDAPVTAVVEPLLTDILGSPQHTSSHALDSPSHNIPLLDVAGGIPTALLDPLPLHLGFLGQPTFGQEPHDAAFSTLGMHHF